MAGIQPLAPCNATSCNFDVGALVDDDWALAAKFQCDWCEVHSCSCHNYATDFPIAGVKDVVKLLC